MEKNVLNILVPFSLMEKWINEKAFREDELIMDPEELEAIEDCDIELNITKEFCESLIKGETITDNGSFETKWNLINSGPEDKIRLLHMVEQNFVSTI